MATAADLIGQRFGANLERVTNLVSIYTSNAGTGQGRRTVRDTDILRAAVVLLHATLEELLRSLAEWKLPAAEAGAFADLPIAGANGRTKIGLHELAQFRGQTVDEVVAKSVSEYLEKSSYSHVGDSKEILEKIGLDATMDKRHAGDLAALISRRHWIAHRVDRNPKRGSGHHPVKSISTQSLSKWIAAVAMFGTNVLSRF
jgi:hypothetical protein